MQKQKESTGNTTKGKQRKTPLVIATIYPDDILNYHMGVDTSAIIKHLASYRKSGVGWDEYRKKIPDDLLNKFRKVINDCRRQGFIAPRTEGEKINWLCIVGDSKYADPCSVCPKTTYNNTCQGIEEIKEDKKIFTPCWKSGT
jgi:hypothetical protein